MLFFHLSRIGAQVDVVLGVVMNTTANMTNSRSARGRARKHSLQTQPIDKHGLLAHGPQS